MRETSNGIFAGAAPTAPNFVARAHALFGDQADAFLKLYPAATDDQAKRSAQDLAGDQFIAFSTWKWIEMQWQLEILASSGMNSMTLRPRRRTAPLLREARTIRRKLNSFLRRWPRKTSPGGRRTRSCLISCLPTGPTSPRPGTRTARVCLTGRPTTASTNIKSCISVRARIRLRTSTGAGTNSLTRCLPISSASSADQKTL